MAAGSIVFGPSCNRPQITDCVISLNLASQQGGGIYCQCDEVAVSNSSIVQNSADYGGGIYCTWPITGFATDWTVTNCLIVRNSAYSGAGIHCAGYGTTSLPEYNYPSPVITNCTITENSASFSGGGILSDLSSPVVTNCILWENAPSQITHRPPRNTKKPGSGLRKERTGVPHAGSGTGHFSQNYLLQYPGRI